MDRKPWKKLSFWRSKARFLFKILLGVGFLIQSYKFLVMYLQYPSMVELDVTQPHEADFPAFTICNLNEIRTSSFCAKYPQKCATIESRPEICDMYPEYCRLIKNTTTLLPLNPVSQYNLSREEMKSFGHQLSDFLVYCKIEIEGTEEDCKGDPVQFSALSHSNNMPFNCYVFYSLYGRPNDKPRTVPLSTVIRFTLNIEVNEYHPEHLSRGAQISIHSPYDIPSPMSDGQLLNLGAIYRFYVRLTRFKLLPAPFKSRCRDYMSEWRENGGKGPVTQKMCKEKCKLDKSLEFFGCADRRINYPHNETLCQMEIPQFHQKWTPRCAKICTIPCSVSRFDFQVQVSNSEGFRNACSVAKDLTCNTLVQIFMENMEITTFSYKPRFEAVGVLSWIGGYVGLWLGISLLHVYDFIEILVFRGIAWLRKGVGRKKKKKAKKGYTLDPYSGAIYLSKMRRRL